MLNSFYISPRIKRIGNGEVCSDYDVQKRISGASKGNMILITGEAGTGKSCFLKKCFLEEFKRRKKDTIVFWVSAELINEKKPKNQFHFFNKILKLKYAKKNRVIIFIDGVDEIFNNEKKNAIEYIEKLRELNICVILGCRRNYYGRIFQKVSFTEIYEIENWKEDQIEKYVKNYLGFCKKEYLYHEIFEKQNCESFLVNPFQCSMLLHLIVSLKKEQIDEIGNIYVLYETFYKYWIYREKERTDSFLEIKDINNIHYKIAREFYRTYNKAFSISKILSPKQKELDCQNQEVIISLLKMRNLFEVESCVAEGFMHMSLCEFLVAKSIIDALLRGGIKLIQSFSLPYRHFEMDFLENGLKSLKLEDARKIKENLENAYILLMPESFREKHYPDMIKEQRWEKRLEQIGNKKLQIIRDQMIFYLGKLPEILIENSKIFEYAFEEDESILVKISAATVIINHDLNFDIEKKYIDYILNDENWEKTLRSWVVVFWQDVIYDDPYSYMDKGGNWNNIKQRRIGRLQMKNTEDNIKYMRTRAIDLAQLWRERLYYLRKSKKLKGQIIMHKLYRSQLISDLHSTWDPRFRSFSAEINWGDEGESGFFNPDKLDGKIDSPDKLYDASNLLNDDTQKILLPYIKETEHLLNGMVKRYDKCGEAHIFPSLDVGFPNNILRLAGGFATGMLVVWKSGTPLVPVDTTVNVCSSSYYEFDESALKGRKVSDFFNQKIIQNIINKGSVKEGLAFSFNTGNHFILLSKSRNTGHYFLVLHSSAKQYKDTYLGLYPKPHNWYSNLIKTYQEKGSDRYIHYLKDDEALRFISIARSLNEQNRDIHNWFASEIFGDIKPIQQKTYHHYGMPTDYSIAIGTYVVDERDVVPIFSREGYPIFLFRPSSNMWSIVLEGKTKYIIPHGWGQELRYDYFAKQIQKEDFKNGKLSIKNGKFVLSNSQHGYYEKKFDIDYSARFNKKQVGVRDLYKTDKFDGKNIFGDTPYIKGTIEEILDPVALFSSDTEGAVKYYVSGEEN